MTQNIKLYFKRNLMDCNQDSNDNNGKCIQHICGTSIIDDYDISNKYEYITSFFLIALFVSFAIVLSYHITKTIKFIKAEKIKTFKLRLTIQIVALLSPIWYIISLAFLNEFYCRLNNGSINFSSQQDYEEELVQKITVYMVFQILSSSCYSLAFFLSFFVWFGVLTVTREEKWIKILNYLFHFTSIACFLFQIVGLFFLIKDNDARISHASVSTSVLIICIQVLTIVLIIRKKIENLYEINYSFKRLMSRYIIWLAVACVFRPLFNLFLTFDVFDGFQCFQYVDYSTNHYQNNIRILENKKITKLFIIAIFSVLNNVSLIPLSLLLSPTRKFRQNNYLQFGKSLHEDFVQSYQREDTASNLEADNKSCTNNS